MTTTAGDPPSRGRRLVRRWLPPVRILASVAILAVLLRKVQSPLPHASVGRRDDPGGWLGGVACSVAGDRAVDDPLAAGARRRWTCPTRFGPLFSTLPRMPVRLELPALRRSAATPCGSPGLSSRRSRDRRPHCTGRVRLGGARSDVGLADPAAAVPGRPAHQPRPPAPGPAVESVALALSVASLGALAAVIAIAASPRFGGRLSGRKGWLRFMGAVHEGIARIRRRPGAVAQVIAVAAAYQLAIVTVALLATQALGFAPRTDRAARLRPRGRDRAGAARCRSAASVCARVRSCCSSSPLGVATDQAVALGLALYAMQLLSSLLGAPSLAVGPRPGGGPALPPGPDPSGSVRARPGAAAPAVAARTASTGLRWWREVALHRRRSTACTPSSGTRKARRAAGPPGASAVIAYHHARGVIRVERDLWIYHEQQIQALLPPPPRCADDPVLRRLEPVVRVGALRRHRRRRDLAVPARPGAATRCGATRSRSRRRWR